LSDSHIPIIPFIGRWQPFAPCRFRVRNAHPGEDGWIAVCADSLTPRLCTNLVLDQSYHFGLERRDALPCLSFLASFSGANPAFPNDVYDVRLRRRGLVVAGEFYTCESYIRFKSTTEHCLNLTVFNCCRIDGCHYLDRRLRFCPRLNSPVEWRDFGEDLYFGDEPERHNSGEHARERNPHPGCSGQSTSGRRIYRACESACE
jgi:hypothetical protein